MAANEIIKRLEWLIFNFPVTGNPKDETERLSNCINLYCQDAVGEINRQKAEIERLQERIKMQAEEFVKLRQELKKAYATSHVHEIHIDKEIYKQCQYEMERVKSEAIKEFEKLITRRLNCNTPRGAHLLNIINEVKKEMVGDDNA